ncbi:UNVERIFIED_ORG: hypothetical protein B2H93_14725 [Clostridium botulinum]
MIKKLNVLLEKVNRNAYDGQFYWNNREEIISDLMEFGSYDKEEENKAYDLAKFVKWEGAGEYVLSMENEEIIKLEKALKNETDGIDLNEILNYCKELENEIIPILEDLEPHKYYNYNSNNDLLESNLDEDYSILMKKTEGYTRMFVKQLDDFLLDNLRKYDNEFVGFKKYEEVKNLNSKIKNESLNLNLHFEFIGFDKKEEIEKFNRLGFSVFKKIDIVNICNKNQEDMMPIEEGDMPF